MVLTSRKVKKNKKINKKKFNCVNVVMFCAIRFAMGETNISKHIHARYVTDIKYKLHHKTLMQTFWGLVVK